MSEAQRPPLIVSSLLRGHGLPYPYELVGYCLRENMRLLVLLNALLKPDENGQGTPSRTGRDDDDMHHTGSVRILVRR